MGVHCRLVRWEVSLQESFIPTWNMVGGISPSIFLMESTASAPVAEGNTSVKIRLNESKGGGTWVLT